MQSLYNTPQYNTVPLFVHFSSFLVNFLIISAQHLLVLESSNFVYMQRAQVYCCKQNQCGENYFCLHFLFSHFLSLSLPNVMIMEVFVKDFSVTTWPRILKFCTTIKYDKLYCVLENRLCIAYQSLYLYIFLSLSNVMDMDIFVFSPQCNEYGNFRQRAVHQYSIQSLAIYLTLFSFSLKELQPLMATVGGMWALLTFCYILVLFEKI